MTTEIDGAPVQLTAYVATSLTGLSVVEREEVEVVSTLIRDACAEFRIRAYLPWEHTCPVKHQDKTPEEVYETDRRRVSDSDLLFFIGTWPTTGGGMELEIAGNRLIPVIFLGKNGVALSRMAKGGLAPCLGTVVYDAPEEIKAPLRILLSRARSEVFFDKYSRWRGHAKEIGVAKSIARARRRKGMKRDDLAKELGITPRHMKMLEELPDRESNPSMTLIRALSYVLDVPISSLLDGSGNGLETEGRDRRIYNFFHDNGLALREYEAFINNYSFRGISEATSDEELWEIYNEWKRQESR